MRKRVAVLVLGDVGHSPRMQYHCLSLARSANLEVDIVGYNNSTPRPEVLANEHITIHGIKELPPLPQIFPSFAYFLYAPFKFLFLVFQLLIMFFFVLHRPDFILVQNPPSIPTLMVAKIVSKIKHSTLIIDWHNYGFTILGLRLGPSSLYVRIAKIFEQFFASSDYAFCVTKGMKRDLKTQFNVDALTLYDRPPPFFCKSSLQQKHELFLRLEKELCLKSVFTCNENETPFTYEDSQDCIVKAKPNHPALIVSSTSWTKDENFAVLLEALVLFDAQVDANPALYPECAVLITGKGPEKEYYEERIQTLGLRHVHIRTVWLRTEDYPVLLGAADLGVSLHTSSSGLDLPMKIVDMFGAGLPVCAVNFPCLPELVKDEENGRIFETADELAEQLTHLLANFPSDRRMLKQFEKHLQNNFQNVRWDAQWNAVALPIFTSPSTDDPKKKD
eukprot:GCRY01003417.1.p1 GENE.GCRY01003417.1~~GCRY01003417.1.p1  ORF type:complete len:447 (-),score=70.21 GCRY01003417.1:42-1382(-)